MARAGQEENIAPAVILKGQANTGLDLRRGEVSDLLDRVVHDERSIGEATWSR